MQAPGDYRLMGRPLMTKRVRPCERMHRTVVLVGPNRMAFERNWVMNTALNVEH